MNGAGKGREGEGRRYRECGCVHVASFCESGWPTVVGRLMGGNSFKITVCSRSSFVINILKGQFFYIATTVSLCAWQLQDGNSQTLNNRHEKIHTKKLLSVKFK